jgi:sulfopyruvate decarboxylase TPP-binding subunit
MRSSGAGNGINMLSLAANGGLLVAMLITIRGEWAGFNSWQVTMGPGTRPTPAAMGVVVHRGERAEEVGEIVAGALALACAGEGAVAVLLPSG